MALQDSVGDLLCLIVDLNPVSWARSAQPSAETNDALSLEQALDQTLVFCNAHLALRHENELAVFAAGPGRSRQLFSSQLTPTTSSSSTPSTSTPANDSNTYQQFRIVDEHLKAGVKEMMAHVPDEPDGGSNLVGALSMALCHINRLSTTDPLSASSAASAIRRPKPRIVVISVTQDSSAQYVPIMNCIFTAQKNNIQIDVCKVFGPDAVFLQQACHLTSGSYYKLARRAGLLQYLMMAFLPGPAAHRHLNQPRQEQVDLRAACFCHRKIVDIGYVCSVCLSIFCSPLPVCSTCRTKFPMSTLKRLGFGARPPGAAGGAGLPRPKKRKVASATPGGASPAASPAPAAA
ncbi:General transcription and DNA repair factor IIH subunit TFB4 [Rhodotorula toruloides]|uniref:General transcription and DNA repair factor IIH subunit TFB4 n=1 Tax=Rhodotorula toruloides TaxID=5286 RepID=A0A0K3CL71_RHOTO|nr:General transcription and DNA repair factor IIH subunit TFB4 [Rhodotorula toruloides]PRQ70995.1 TFIIH subunit Tfb4/p34 [Rhodotorula toruloides]